MYLHPLKLERNGNLKPNRSKMILVGTPAYGAEPYRECDQSISLKANNKRIYQPII